ncbi:hypothetical protein TNCV_1983631 [Trichonephila clavipes]|nr:hypothetical protein TNCV_1983631 [Trichonephila clavipes]
MNNLFSFPSSDIGWIFTSFKFVGVPGNETTDELAGRGCDLPAPSSSVLCAILKFIPSTIKMNLTSRKSAHHWYAAKSSGLTSQCRRSRALQMVLERFRRGHLRGMTFVQG